MLKNDFTKEHDLKKYIPLFILFIISATAFIIATFFDKEISNFFSQGEKYVAVKWWIGVYDELGVFLVVLLVFIPLFVILESFVYARKEKKKAKGRWIWIAYTSFFVIWGLIAYVFVISIDENHMKMGATIGYDPKILGSYIYRYYGRIAAISFSSLVMIITMFYLRFKFSKKKNVLTGEFWVDSLKIWLFSILAFGLMFLIKQSTGRPFYYNTVFDDQIKKVLEDAGVQWDTDRWGQTEYLPWYKVNGNFFDNLNFWQPWGDHLDGANHWGDRDFPSGHTVTAYSMGAFFLYFVGKNKEKKWTKKCFLIPVGIWTLNLLSMNFMLVTYRFHWMTDTTFSIMMSTLLFPISIMIINKIIRIKIVRFNAKRNQVKSVILVEFKYNKAYVKVNSHGYPWRIKTIKVGKKSPRVVLNKIIYQCEKYLYDINKIEFEFANETFKDHEYKNWISEFRKFI